MKIMENPTIHYQMPTEGQEASAEIGRTERSGSFVGVIALVALFGVGIGASWFYLVNGH